MLHSVIIYAIMYLIKQRSSYKKGGSDMANFAINCSDEIINRGNALIAKMAEGTDEKKGETLNRIFALVEKSMDDVVMQNNGVDTKGLDAALGDIRKMFESVSSSRERLLAEKDQKISQLQVEKADLKSSYEDRIQAAIAEKEDALQMAEKAAKEMDSIQKQADTAASLATEKEKINAMLTTRLAEADAKLTGYDDLKTSEKEARENISDLQRKIDQMQKDHAAEIKDLLKDAAIALERAVTEKEREMQDKLQTAELETAKLSGKIEMLEARIKELSAEKHSDQKTQS